MVAVIAAGLVTLLLFLCVPITVSVPGDHESATCSIAQAYAPQPSPDHPERTWETVRDRCDTARYKRFVLAGIAVLATAAGMVLVARRYDPRRRRLRP
jgi:hypothetical protein